MEEQAIYILIGAGSFFALVIGLFAGMMLDIHKRAKMLRSLTKRDYGILAIVSKDSHSIKRLLVNFQNDSVKRGNEIWVIMRKRIYREDKPEKGFAADESNTRWEEGVPCVYVDKESLKPISLYHDEEVGKVRPEEVGAVLTSWVNNQLAKGYAAIQQTKMLLYVAIVVALLAAGVAYEAYTEAQATHADVKEIRGILNGTISAHPAEGGATVITQPTPSPRG